MGAGSGKAVLAIDIGGTKMLGALVADGAVSDTAQIETPGSGDPRGWIETLLKAGRGWPGRYHLVGAAVTGIVTDGRWSALNPRTLSVPADYPLANILAEATGRPAIAANDAQAAAWGEFTRGAGAGTRDCVFLTISTGIGGGVVVNGRLLEGLAGHFGQLRSDVADSAPFENLAAGRWIAEMAQRSGHETDARGVFLAAGRGEHWADEIVALSARRIATLIGNIALGLAPQRIIIGGSIGLAPGFIGRMESHLAEVPEVGRTQLVPARLGAQAGIVGIAELAASRRKGHINQREHDHA